MLEFIDSCLVQADEAEVVEESVKRDLSGLSQKQLLALFKQSSPEFDGIVLDFKVFLY
jgi:hypothetical protein